MAGRDKVGVCSTWVIGTLCTKHPVLSSIQESRSVFSLGYYCPMERSIPALFLFQHSKTAQSERWLQRAFSVQSYEFFSDFVEFCRILSRESRSKSSIVENFVDARFCVID